MSSQHPPREPRRLASVSWEMTMPLSPRKTGVRLPLGTPKLRTVVSQAANRPNFLARKLVGLQIAFSVFSVTTRSLPLRCSVLD